MSEQWPTETVVKRGAAALRKEADWRVMKVEQIVRLVLSGVGLPALFGTTDTAQELGVSTGGLNKVRDLPDPVYPGDDGKPSGGRLWLAEEIRELAESRLAKA